MAGNDVSRKPTTDQLRLIAKDVKELRKIVDFMLANHVIPQYNVDIFLKCQTESDKRKFLTDYLDRRGAKEFSVFIDALVATNQVELAKALKPNLNLDQKQNNSSGDGNCISAGNKNGGDENSTSAESGEPLMMEPPSPEAIKRNEDFYHVENKVYHNVPETDGIMSDLQVVLSNDLPPGFTLEECYPHFSKPKGLALIFNNRRFRRKSGMLSTLPERLGTDVDCKNLDRLLTQLGYQVHVKNDLPAKEMLDAMSRFSFKSEHEKCHSAVVVVLSHGTHGQVYGSDEELIKIETLIKFVDSQNCPKLRNKPKIFIIQACRGDHYDEGVDGYGGHERADGGAGGENAFSGDEHLARVEAIKRLAEMDETDARMIEKTPTGADILIGYATTPGYVSWRNTYRGSWFVQAICEVFAKEAHREEIQHLFTRVNKLVASNLSSTGHVQVPEPSSRLTKKFYLLPGYKS